MTHSDNQYQSSSLTFSMMISEAVYKAVVGVERAIRLITKLAHSQKPEMLKEVG